MGINVMALSNGLTDEFKAHTKLAAEKHAFAQLAVEMGLKADEPSTQEFISPSVSHEEALIAEGQKRAVQLRVGMGDAENLSGGLMGAGAAEAARKRAKAEEKEAKQRLADAQFQALLDQLSALGAEIDATAEKIAMYDRKIDALESAMIGLKDGTLSIDDAMNDPEVAEAVRAWEARTGKKFDRDADNAADALVGILAVQRDEYLDERNALVQRHNDLVDEYNGIAEKVPDIDERYKIEPRAAKAETLALAEQSHLTALAVQAETDEAELAEIGISAIDGVFEIEQGVISQETEAAGIKSIGIGLDKRDSMTPFNTAAALPELDDSKLEFAMSEGLDLESPKAT